MGEQVGQAGEQDRLATTALGGVVPTGVGSGLVDEVETDGQIDALLDVGVAEDFGGADTRVLEPRATMTSRRA